MTESASRSDRKTDPLQVYAQADQPTRALIQQELDRIDELEQRDLALRSRGLTYGVVVTLVFLGACVFLVAGGHGVEGTILGVVFIAALVSILAVGRRH